MTELIPFCLYKALTGSPVITRTGRPAKIWYNPDSRDGDRFLVGVIEGSSTFNLWKVTGKKYTESESDDDLFMAEDHREL